MLACVFFSRLTIVCHWYLRCSRGCHFLVVHGEKIIHVRHQLGLALFQCRERRVDAVKVVVDGHGRIQALTLHPDFLKEGAAVVEPALVAALQEAADRARALHEATMSKATAGFQLPGL